MQSSFKSAAPNCLFPFAADQRLTKAGDRGEVRQTGKKTKLETGSKKSNKKKSAREVRE